MDHDSTPRAQRTQSSLTEEHSENPRASAISAVSAFSVDHRIQGEIEFRHLSFSYGTTPILIDISAHIPAGQTVALVGPTGSGKSTLISLIARLYDPPAGTVLVDGRDVREIPLAELRGAIGF